MCASLGRLHSFASLFRCHMMPFALLPRWALLLDRFRGGRCASGAYQPGGFCSSFLRHSSLPWWSRHVCWMFNSWVEPASRAHFSAVRSGSRSLLWPLRPTSFTFPLPPALAKPKSSRSSRGPVGQAEVQSAKPKSSRPSRSLIGVTNIRDLG